MPKLSAVIIEDEPLAARGLELLLHKTGKVEVTGKARNGNDGIVLCADYLPDVAFLDIHMPGPDGLELAAHLSLLPRPPLIVFTTGHKERAHEAFRLNAVDYLLKPLDPALVWEAVCRLETRVAVGQNDTQAPSPPKQKLALGLVDDRLPVKSGVDDIVKLLPIHEIVAAIHHDRRTWIHTHLEELPTYYSLTDLMEWMCDPLFIRVSRRAIVSLQGVDLVTHYGDRLYQVRLRDRSHSTVEASRSGAKRLAELLRHPK
jgi:DNA-binding LytR/AlgR family response regulator